MPRPPANPKIYHITHVDNLTAIVDARELLSDREVLQRGGATQKIVMSAIKRRRLESLEVPCHRETKVGDYVPFYFCPRSVMLYVIHRANHPELTYKDGQDPIVHLEADLMQVISWAEQNERPWAFSLSNAGAFYTDFRSRRSELDQLDWPSIASADFRDSRVMENKQAEFLMHERFPFAFVDRIGVLSPRTWNRAANALSGAGHRPLVEKRPDWYF